MDRFTSLTRLRVRLLTWRINLLWRLASRTEQQGLAFYRTQRVWAMQNYRTGLQSRLRRPQMWLETHPPQDQPSPTP